MKVSVLSKKRLHLRNYLSQQQRRRHQYFYTTTIQTPFKHKHKHKHKHLSQQRDSHQYFHTNTIQEGNGRGSTVELYGPLGSLFLSYLRLTEVLVTQGKFVSDLVWSHCVWKGFRLSGVEQSPSTLYIHQSNNKRINLKI